MLVAKCIWRGRLTDVNWQTALHKAALHGHLRIITYLLPDRADVHTPDADGWTALHNACSKVYLLSVWCNRHVLNRYRDTWIL